MGNDCKWKMRTLAAVMLVAAAVAAADEANSGTRPMANQQRVDQSRYLEAAAAAQRGDYVVAYCFWRPLAEKGDAEAQYALGWMYHNGYGLVTDDRSAKGWWEKAAAQDHLDAMFSLGTLYSVGSESVARDYSAAMRLWGQAAAAGHENARFALRELAARNLPELNTLSQSLRKQYPQLLGVLPARRNIKTRLNTTTHTNSSALAGQSAAQKSLPLLRHSGEWIAVAAGYRPEYGWAVAQLIRGGGKILSSSPQ